MMQRLGGQKRRVAGEGGHTGQELEQTVNHSGDNGIPNSEIVIKQTTKHTDVAIYRAGEQKGRRGKKHGGGYKFIKGQRGPRHWNKHTTRKH